MKFSLKSLLLLPLLVVGLASCGEPAEPPATDEELVEQVANLGAFILNKKGDPLQNGFTYQTEFGDTYLGLKEQKFDDRVVKVTWSGDNEAHPVSVKTGGKGGRYIIKPEYVYSEAEAYTLKLTAEIKLNDAVAHNHYNIDVAYGVIQEITLENAVKAFIDESIDLSGKTLYKFDAQVTGYYNPEDTDTGYNNGLYVQNGEYATMLHKGVLTTALKGENLKAGTNIRVTGIPKSFYGLFELTPIDIQILDKDAATITPITPLEVTDASWWSEKGAVPYQSRLVNLNVTFVSYDGKASGSGSSNAKFKLGEKQIDIRLNKYLGAEANTALNEKFKTLTAGDTCKVECMIGWYNGPQGSFQFTSKTPADCLVKTN